jgi:molybdopterin-guanine dinucleotide biosynthesis protein A
MKIGAVILAGGKSRRMNYNNKSFLSFDGETFIEKIIHVLERRFDDIIIIANDE